MSKEPFTGYYTDTKTITLFREEPDGTLKDVLTVPKLPPGHSRLLLALGKMIAIQGDTVNWE